MVDSREAVVGVHEVTEDAMAVRDPAMAGMETEGEIGKGGLTVVWKVKGS